MFGLVVMPRGRLLLSHSHCGQLSCEHEKYRKIVRFLCGNFEVFCFYIWFNFCAVIFHHITYRKILLLTEVYLHFGSFFQYFRHLSNAFLVYLFQDNFLEWDVRWSILYCSIVTVYWCDQTSSVLPMRLSAVSYPPKWWSDRFQWFLLKKFLQKSDLKMLRTV